MNSTALVSIPVGVVVERHKATSPWLDFVWRPVSVLAGVPSAAPWTPLGPVGDTDHVLRRHRHHRAVPHRDGELPRAISTPARRSLWVVLRPTDAEPPYEVLAVTADPAEGEAFTEAGNDLVDTVPMPTAIAEALEAFIAEHHVERPFFKRQRDRGRQPAGRTGGREGEQ